MNIPSSLQKREIGALTSQQFKQAFRYLSLSQLANERFQKFNYRIGQIMEIVPTCSLVFLVSSRGKCIAVDKFTGRQVQELTSPEGIAKTLFYNRSNDTVILITVQSPGQLKTQFFYIKDLEQGIRRSVDLFSNENMRSPGFLEFDDVNEVILTRSANNRIFKFWNLRDYTFRFALNDSQVEEIRLTTDLVLLVYPPESNILTSKLLSISNGSVLNVFQFELAPHKPIELLELFNEYLLLKQTGEVLVIYNLLHSTQVKAPNFISPQAFIFLQMKMKFLALRQGVMELWDFEGKCLKVYNAPLTNDNIGPYIPSRLFITRTQDILLLCMKDKPNSQNRETGCLKIIDLLKGSVVGEIKQQRVLTNVTTLAYDEYYGTIYTGHRNGNVLRWVN